MRRFWLLLMPALALVSGAAAAAFLTSAPAPGPQSATQSVASTGEATGTPTTTDRAIVPLPDLDVPPLEPDPAWWQSDNAPYSIGVTWVSRVGSDPSGLLDNDVQRRLYESFLACFPDGATNEELYQAKVECFDERAIRSAATTPNPTDTFAAIRALNTARPDVFTICHNASHKVGEIALKRIVPVYGIDAEIIAALLDRGANACMGGLMHGTLDAIGLLVDDVESFRPAIEACLLANPENLGYCTDAVGHATWDAFGDIPQAAAVCSFFSDVQSRRECGEGVLMRIYQRGEDTDPWYTGDIVDDAELQRWNDAVVAICETWPATPFSTAAPENPQEWCWSGSVYLLFKPVFFSLLSKNGEIEPVFDAVDKRLGLAIEACTQFPAPGDDLCMARMGPSVGHLAAFEKPYAEKLCQRFPTEAARLRCVDDAYRRIDNAFLE